VKDEVKKEVQAALGKEGEQGGGDERAVGEGAAAKKSECDGCEGLVDVGKEEGCGPLCKLERLVGQLQQ
jgi:hypothetical protein